MEEIKHVISMVYRGDHMAMAGYTKAIEKRERKQREEMLRTIPKTEIKEKKQDKEMLMAQELLSKMASV